jgi:hypothetical protein
MLILSNHQISYIFYLVSPTLVVVSNKIDKQFTRAVLFVVCYLYDQISSRFAGLQDKFRSAFQEIKNFDSSNGPKHTFAKFEQPSRDEKKQSSNSSGSNERSKLKQSDLSSSKETNDNGVDMDELTEDDIENSRPNWTKIGSGNCGIVNMTCIKVCHIRKRSKIV